MASDVSSSARSETQILITVVLALGVAVARTNTAQRGGR